VEQREFFNWVHKEYILSTPSFVFSCQQHAPVVNKYKRFTGDAFKILPSCQEIYLQEGRKIQEKRRLKISLLSLFNQKLIKI
jgi:hypothetical protein